MKILLLGDYSGFHLNLKEGLIELGHSVKMATDGDGFKKISDSDLPMPKHSKSRLGRIANNIAFPLLHLDKLSGFDVVQLISSNLFGMLKIDYNYIMLKKIKSRNAKLFMSACGTDYFVYKNRETFRYNPFDACINIDLNGVNDFIRKEYISNNTKTIDLVDGIIPTLYTYAEAYRKVDKRLKTIPFPINVDKIEFIPQNIENNKLKIFHGINREGFKGTKYIVSAMKKLEKNYPNDVEIIIDGKMPLSDYLQVLKEANIVIDQALSYEYGMNAVYSMAMGKVVLGGNEPECQKEFNRYDIPIINIKPSEDDIYFQLEKLVLDKQSVIELGRKSRLFVEEFHHYVKVAEQYIEAWSSVEVGK